LFVSFENEIRAGHNFGESLNFNDDEGFATHKICWRIFREKIWHSREN
jgi:hypothetical protein